MSSIANARRVNVNIYPALMQWVKYGLLPRSSPLQYILRGGSVYECELGPKADASLLPLYESFVSTLVQHAPMACYGSGEKVHEWAYHRGLTGSPDDVFIAAMLEDSKYFKMYRAQTKDPRFFMGKTI